MERRRLLKETKKPVPAGYIDFGLPSGTLWASGVICKNDSGNYYIGSDKYKTCYFGWGDIRGEKYGDSLQLIFGYNGRGHLYWGDSSKVMNNPAYLILKVDDWNAALSSIMSPLSYNDYMNNTYIPSIPTQFPQTAEYDACMAIFGNDFKVPTKEDWEELIANVSVHYYNSGTGTQGILIGYENSNGYIDTSRPNIGIPIDGFMATLSSTNVMDNSIQSDSMVIGPIRINDVYKYSAYNDGWAATEVGVSTHCLFNVDTNTYKGTGLTNYTTLSNYSNGTYIDAEEMFILGMPICPVWKGNAVKLPKKHLRFVAEEDTTFSFTTKGSGNNVQYSLDDGETWTDLASGASTPTIIAGNSILWRSTRTPGTSSYGSNQGIGTFSSTGEFSACGNAMSMLYGDMFDGEVSLSGKNYAFYKLFQNCTKLIDASDLELPATTLSLNCYGYMFSGCSSLITAPTLPAETLVSNCYRYMFLNCSSLCYIEALFITTPSNSYTNNWVSGVAASGTFVKSTFASWNVTGNNGVPRGWSVLTAEGFDLEMVDLGLSVKWANVNIGAQSLTDPGNMYLWGLGSKTYLETARYVTGQSLDASGYTTPLDSSHDTAQVVWGNGWRMPTVDEVLDLIDNTTVSTQTIDGVLCFKLTSTINQKYILLPNTPVINPDDGTDITDPQYYGAGFWSSEKAPRYGYNGPALYSVSKHASQSDASINNDLYAADAANTLVIRAVHS